MVAEGLYKLGFVLIEKVRYFYLSSIQMLQIRIFIWRISMACNTDVLRLLGTLHPITQVAGVSTPAMAAVVSNAGALGSIGIGACNSQQAQTMIRETRALTTGSINVNVFCHAPAIDDTSVSAAWCSHLQSFFDEFGERPPAHLSEIYPSFMANRATFEVLLNERPKVVSFHFGLPPEDWIRSLRGGFNSEVQRVRRNDKIKFFA
jgi:nitronate monooxygenase